MRRRLLALLVVAAGSGLLAGTVASAKGRNEAHPRIPALPHMREVANACPMPARYSEAFHRAARDTDLPLAMLVAVGRVESHLTPTARSRAGARYLRLQLDRFQSPDLALAAYNAGPTAVASAGGAPSTETASYVANGTSIWRDLRGCR